MSTSSRFTGDEIRRIGRAHEHVAVKSEVLLNVLAHVRVIPVDAGVGKAHEYVNARPARRVLCQPEHAVGRGCRAARRASASALGWSSRS